MHLTLPYSFPTLCPDLTSLSLLLVSLILSSVNNFHSLLSSDPMFCLVFLMLLMNLQNDFLFPLIILLLANLFYAWPFDYVPACLCCSSILTFSAPTYCLSSVSFLPRCEVVGPFVYLVG